MSNISVVIGLDFGTTYSGFAYCQNFRSKEILTYTQWPGEVNLKTNTVLQYDDDFENVEQWGQPVLFTRGIKRVNLFKLHLGNLKKKPKLQVDFKKAITDYLREIGELIKETVNTIPKVKFFKNVLLIVTVPAEYSENDKAIMRKCIYDAGLLEEERSQKLQFTTEPEAAAIHCMEDKLKEYDLLTIGTTFMVVDCGGGTVDLTTRKLVGENQLGEITERIGDFCGSTFIDSKFIEFLGRELGTDAINKLEEDNYDQIQCLVQQFCRRVKLPFAGDNMGFSYELDIEEYAPDLLDYVSEETRNIMEDQYWLVKIKYNDVKKMFDPIINRIIEMIHRQLQNNRETCSAIFLVGGFSENRYLQKRVRDVFQQSVKTIVVPTQPIAAIVCGAVKYGLNIKDYLNKMEGRKRIIFTRTLKFTYGIKVLGRWNKDHPLRRKIYDDRIYLFDTLAEKGTEVEVDQKISSEGYKPLNSSQTAITFELFKTSERNPKYHDEPGMILVGTLRIFLPGDLSCNKFTFGFSLGEMEITAFAENEDDGTNFQTKFELSQFER